MDAFDGERAVATVDARNYLCPVPVLRLRRRVRLLPAGSRVDVLATDRAAPLDVAAYCGRFEHEYLGCDEIVPGVLRIRLRTRGPEPFPPSDAVL